MLWAVSGPHACRGSPPPSSRSYTVTVKLSLAAVAVCAAITCLAAGAATLPGSDEFNSTELTGDDVGDGTEHSIAVQGGALPRSLQVGMDAFTGFEAPHGDLISHVDWFRFAPLAPPAKLRTATPAKLLPYLSRA